MFLEHQIGILELMISEGSCDSALPSHKSKNIFKYKTAVLNFNNISQYYGFTIFLIK